MKVALYHPWVYLKSGLERSLLEIAKRSRFDWTIFSHHYDKNGTYPELENFDVVQLSPSVSVERSFSQVMRASLRIMKTELPMEQYDALVVSSEGVGDFINFRNHEKPIIALCHTPLKIIHDYESRDYYLQTHPGVQLRYQFFSAAFKLVDGMAWRYYSNVISNSAEVKNRILRANLTDDSSITIIHPGIDVEKMNPTWQYEPYFLIPGRIMWQKNIQLGIRAFQEFRERTDNSSFRLIIAGMVDQKSQPYYKELKEIAGNGSGIEFVVEPTDEQLFSLYESCYAVLFTARNEDWGIVPLEGMAFGKPVISIARGGPLESILAGQTGYLLDDNPSLFAEKMGQLASDPDLVREIGRNGYEHAKQYNWDSFVESVDDLVEHTVKTS
jgi:glycosyltransferase involved in cell wall biosynthesis